MKKSKRQKKVVLRLDPLQVKVVEMLRKHDKTYGECKSIKRYFEWSVLNSVESFAQITNDVPRYLRRCTDGSVSHAELLAYVKKHTPKKALLNRIVIKQE